MDVDPVASALDRMAGRLDQLAIEAVEQRARAAADTDAARQRVIDHVTALAADVRLVQTGLGDLNAQMVAGLGDLHTRVSAIEILTRTAMVLEGYQGVPLGPPPPQEFVDALAAQACEGPVAVPLDVPGIGPVVAHVDPDPTADPQLEMSGVVSSLRQNRSHLEESRGQHPSSAPRAPGRAERNRTERPPGR